MYHSLLPFHMLVVMDGEAAIAVYQEGRATTINSWQSAAQSVKTHTAIGLSEEHRTGQDSKALSMRKSEASGLCGYGGNELSRCTMCSLQTTLWHHNLCLCEMLKLLHFYA